jgi:hypothetical protein
MGMPKRSIDFALEGILHLYSIILVKSMKHLKYIGDSLLTWTTTYSLWNRRCGLFDKYFKK